MEQTVYLTLQNGQVFKGKGFGASADVTGELVFATAMAIILAQNIENPVLIDKYLMGTELEIDAICDGEDILIPGIMVISSRAASIRTGWTFANGL